ncbi:MAG: NTP transferase domain-containing protein [Patescibacteria group bacterium]
MSSNIYGLVLAGGRSRRMGKDKGMMDWHGKKQRYYMADVLSEYCDKVYISCRKDQKNDIEEAGYNTLVDNFTEVGGPYGALISAMQSFDGVSWLVVACDLPFFDKSSIKTLIQNRDMSKIATVYQSPIDSLPEPLAGIWEPASLQVLKNLFREQNVTCPRKALIKSAEKVKLIVPTKDEEVMNVNTAEDATVAKEISQNE